MYALNKCSNKNYLELLCNTSSLFFIKPLSVLFILKNNAREISLKFWCIYIEWYQMSAEFSDTSQRSYLTPQNCSIYSDCSHIYLPLWQLSNLRLSQIERNKEIMSMKRQLLLQEANNLLLQADITRRETELIRYKHYAKGTSAIKRWNTYGGMEGRVVWI